MVDCCSHNSDFLMPPRQWVLEHIHPINLRRCGQILCSSRYSQYPYRCYHAMSSSSDGMAASDFHRSEDSIVHNFLDRCFVRPIFLFSTNFERCQKQLTLINIIIVSLLQVYLDSLCSHEPVKWILSVSEPRSANLDGWFKY